MSKVQVEKLHSLTGHRDSVYTLEDLENDSRFFSGAGDGMVVLWDLDDPENGQLVARVPNSIYSIRLDKKSGLLLVGHNYEGIHVIDWQAKQEVGNLKFTKGSIFTMEVIGDEVIVGDSTGKLYRVDFHRLRVLGELELSKDRIRSIAVNPIDNQIAVGTSDNDIYILNPKTLEVIQVIQGHTNSVFSLAYHPSGNYLFSVGRDANIRIWEVDQAYAPVQSIIGHMYTINNLEFSPDGKHFVTCSMDKSIKVWDAQTFSLLKVIDKARHAGHGTSVNRLLWKSYNHTLLSASDDRTISSWQLEFFN